MAEKVVPKKGKVNVNPPEEKGESYVFFYGKQSPFSQHHPAKFSIDGVVFNCAEQYMMYAKAVLFKDEEMKKKIMSSDNPVLQKKFGRQVKNFEKDVWNQEAEKVVKTSTRAKFDQNEDLRKELFATFPKTFAEASPRDRIWGIGLGASNPKALNKSNWRGRNKLGYILTEVRNELMKDYE
uniref:NADAR domain-containing protein n=1 Tax=Arion vulgaris TaxID=1028688 RepID=A0A0B6YSJ9_9EUPU